MPLGKEQEALTKQEQLVVDFREISVTGSKYMHTKGIVDYNPDALVGRKGLEIYQKMRDDDQVKAVITMKKFARIMTPFEIQPASEDPMDVEICEFVKTNFENIDGTFEDCLLNMFTAFDFGFCLHGDTIIHSPSGDKKIKDLEGKEVWVYAFDLVDKEIKLVQSKPVVKTGINKEVIKISYAWYAGGKVKTNSLICTPEHPILLKDGTYKKAGEIKEGDRIEPLNRKVGKITNNVNGGIHTGLKIKLGERNGRHLGKRALWQKEYHFVYEQVHNCKIPKGFDIHHIDGNKFNNDPDNLVMLSSYVHKSMHTKKNWAKFTKEERHLIALNRVPSLTRGETVTQRNFETWSDPIKRNNRIQGIKREFDGRVREKLFEGNRKYWEDPKKRAEHSANCKIAQANPETKEEQHISLVKAWERRKLRCSKDNHVVINVEKAGCEDVYDMEVPIYHNFAANNIFVHNSVTEKVWYKIGKGKFAGKIGLKALKTREPFYYGFETDDFGNLREDGVVYQGPTNVDLNKLLQNNEKSKLSMGGYRLPVDKFVIYSYNKEFSNYYGQSDLRSAYRSWWSKEILIRFMNIYMERFGMPLAVGTYPKGLSKPDKDALNTVLDNIQAKYAITIPEDMKVELLGVGTGGENQYRSAIEMHNKFISRSILVPDLMGFNEMSGGGSYALGKKHFDVFLWILQKLGRDVEETLVGEQIIKQLVDYNYNNVVDYPSFKFESITAEGTATRANIIQMGVTGGFINPEEEWIREYLAIPKRDKKFALGIQPPQQAGFPGTAGLVPSEQPIDTGDKGTAQGTGEPTNTVPEEPKPEEFRMTKEYVEAIKRWKSKKFASKLISIDKVIPNEEQSKVIDYQKVTGMMVKLNRGEELAPIQIDENNNLIDGHHRLAAYKKANRNAIPYKVVQETKKFQKAKSGKDLPQDSRFDYKIDFKKMEDDLNEYELETVEVLSKIVQQQKEAFLKSIEKKRIVEDKDYKAVEAIQLKFVGDFKKEFEGRLVKLFLDSKLEALREIAEGSNGKIEVVTKFANVTIQPWIPVQPTDAIDFFNRKVLTKIIKKDGTKKLIELATRKILPYYSGKAFAIAGIERQSILDKAKFILLEGIKSGDPANTMYGLSQLFDKYLQTGELVDDELTTPFRLETIVRTNFSEALNAGRKSMMDDLDVSDFVPYRQYSAILDSRVRESHAEMNGRIYRSDNPIWDLISPPNGYNCFPAGTKVRVFSCDRWIYIPIENVKHGDLVFTHLGNSKRVIELHKNKHIGDLIEIEMENGQKLKATSNHLIMTKNRGWVKISELDINDDIDTKHSISVRRQWQGKAGERKRNLIINTRKENMKNPEYRKIKKEAALKQWLGAKGLLRKEKWGLIISIRNKNRTKEEHPNFGRHYTDEQKKNVSNGTRIAMKRPEVVLKHALGIKNRDKLGRISGENNPMYGRSPGHGKGCWFDVLGQGKVYLKSSYEIIVAKYLTDKNVNFRYEYKRFFLDAKTFLPDFYLVDKNKFIEVKGYVRDKDIKKMNEMKQFYPEVKIEMITDMNKLEEVLT
uniref:Uncharacterized protein n=1 Tax=viral metagenome TaxID=1070528 RepID=A0A6M3ITT5_9ZZZZ